MITFDSKVEGEYYKKLICDFSLKKINSFKNQPIYTLQDGFIGPNGKIRAITYKADFEVVHLDGTIEVIDIKGMATEVANIKRKLFLWTYNDIKLTWISYVKKYGGWIDYFELKKLRRKNKK